MDDKEGKLIRLFTEDKWTVNEETDCWEWNRFRDAHGYGKIGTRIEGRGVATAASRVALRVKLGRPLELGMLACHTCDNPPCVNPDHLYEGTPKQNSADMMERNRHNDSFMLGGLVTRKLQQEDAVDIRERTTAGEYQADLAREYGVSVSTIWAIVAGRKYVFEGPVPHISNRARRGFTNEQIAEAKARVRAGERQSAVAREYGIDTGTMSRIMAGTLYKDVP